jgi:acyl-CoA synthetase (AMP-forming)/AMP-acid ligase II
MSAIRDDPRYLRLLKATSEVVKSGSPFELARETVLGQPMDVYRNRHQSLTALVESAARFGTRAYLVTDDGRRLTYGDLPSAVASVARGLQRIYGIRKGDRAAIYAANCPEWILTFWACAVLGAQTVAMNGWWTGPEATLALELTDPKLLVIDKRRADRLGSEVSIPTIQIESDFATLSVGNENVDLPKVEIAEDDPVVLLFTSGTTGRPKAAVLSHRIVIAFCMTQMMIGARARLMSNTPLDPSFVPVNLAVFPLFHVSGLLATAVSSLYSGQTNVWPLGRFDPKRIIELTHREGINLWIGSSTHIVKLLEHPDSIGIDPTQLRGVGIGGSASTPELIRRVEERFPHLANTVSSGYGSTESGGMASSAPNFMLTLAPDCVGLPHPTVQARIVDDAGNALPDGAEGNIMLRSPMVMIEYLGHPEANAETLTADRWLQTGDYGRLEDGLLFLESRRRDMIIRGGENIFPIEVENCLESYPGVEEVAVYGVDDPTYGQIVHAVVVPRQGTALDLAALEQHCGSMIARYKVPAQFEIALEPLPRNATGKVVKAVLAGRAPAQFIEE